MENKVESSLEKLLAEKHFVSKAMIRHGGSFVNTLGQALSLADIENTKKINQTWPEYWKQYLEMAVEDAFNGD